MPKLPGAFAPSCHTHYTILQTNLIQGVTINGPGAKPYALFDILKNWLGGTKPDVLVAADPRTDTCPGER